MSFASSSTSFTRFKVTDPIPSNFWLELPDKLRQFAILDIDDSPEEKSIGWVAFEDMLDTTFSMYPITKAEFVTFALRVDTRKIPPAVIKKHLAIALKKEEAHNREMGKQFISKERKKEVKEQVLLRLRQRFLPVPAMFYVLWNKTNNIILFTSVQDKMKLTFEELFTKSFNLSIQALNPYDLAEHINPNSKVLETIESTNFI